MKFEDIELGAFYRSDIDVDKTYYFLKKENEFGLKSGYGYVSPTSSSKHPGDNYIIFVLWKNDPILVRRETASYESKDFFNSLHKIQPDSIKLHGVIKLLFDTTYDYMM